MILQTNGIRFIALWQPQLYRLKQAGWHSKDDRGQELLDAFP
jgi:hypothetical protein